MMGKDLASGFLRLRAYAEGSVPSVQLSVPAKREGAPSLIYRLSPSIAFACATS